jgi:hypothetical protein
MEADGIGVACRPGQLTPRPKSAARTHCFKPFTQGDKSCSHQRPANTARGRRSGHQGAARQVVGAGLCLIQTKAFWYSLRMRLPWRFAGLLRRALSSAVVSAMEGHSFFLKFYASPRSPNAGVADRLAASSGSGGSGGLPDLAGRDGDQDRRPECHRPGAAQPFTLVDVRKTHKLLIGTGAGTRARHLYSIAARLYHPSLTITHMPSHEVRWT